MCFGGMWIQSYRFLIFQCGFVRVLLRKQAVSIENSEVWFPRPLLKQFIQALLESDPIGSVCNEIRNLDSKLCVRVRRVHAHRFPERRTRIFVTPHVQKISASGDVRLYLFIPPVLEIPKTAG